MPGTTVLPMDTNITTEITATNDASHVFVGIDGRCDGCDVRPFTKPAAFPCPVR